METISLHCVTHPSFKMFFVLGFVLILLRINSVLCEVCDVTDPDCTTKGAKNNFGPFVHGIDDIVEASDPLWIDKIEDKRDTITYKLTNASLSGMKDCDVTSMKVDRTALTFLCNLECPHLEVKSDYEVKGNILTLYVEGKGILTITADDYGFLFNCKYEKTVDDNGNIHVHITSHHFDVAPKGTAKFDYTNLFNGDKEKSKLAQSFINANSKTMLKLFRTPTIDRYMNMFIANLNKFLKAVPVQKILPSKS